MTANVKHCKNINFCCMRLAIHKEKRKQALPSPLPLPVASHPTTSPTVMLLI